MKQEGYPIWPDDETLTATSLKDAGFPCRDLNDIIPGVYTQRTFDATQVLVNKQLAARLAKKS